MILMRTNTKILTQDSRSSSEEVSWSHSTTRSWLGPTRDARIFTEDSRPSLEVVSWSHSVRRSMSGTNTRYSNTHRGFSAIVRGDLLVQRKDKICDWKDPCTQNIWIVDVVYWSHSMSRSVTGTNTRYSNTHRGLLVPLNDTIRDWEDPWTEKIFTTKSRLERTHL